MNSIADIRDGLYDVLLAAYGSDWNVSQYVLASPNPPQLDMACGPIPDYDTAMRLGNYDLQFRVRAIVQWGELDSSQAQLDGILDPLAGLKSKVEADKTLGGVVDAVRVVSVTELQVFGVQGGTELPGVEFTIAVTP